MNNMKTIIKREKLSPKIKECTCFYCKSVFTYEDEDVTPTPYPDDPRELDSMICPVCEKTTPIGWVDWSNRGMPEYRVRLYKMAMDKINVDKNTFNPLANAVIKMIDAKYTDEEIFDKLIDMGGEIFGKFSKLIAAFPAQHYNPDLLK